MIVNIFPYNAYISIWYHIPPKPASGPRLQKPLYTSVQALARSKPYPGEYGRLLACRYLRELLKMTELRINDLLSNDNYNKPNPTGRINPTGFIWAPFFFNPRWSIFSKALSNSENGLPVLQVEWGDELRY